MFMVGVVFGLTTAWSALLSDYKTICADLSVLEDLTLNILTKFGLKSSVY